MYKDVYIPPIGTGRINEELFILSELIEENASDEHLSLIFRSEYRGYCRALQDAGIITKEEKEKLMQ